jgi:hypothetical protein
LTGYEIVQGDPVDVGVGPDFVADASVECPAGKVVLSGGVTVGDSSLLINVTESQPTEDAGTFGWHVAVQNYEESAGNTATAYAVCATEAA